MYATHARSCRTINTDRLLVQFPKYSSNALSFVDQSYQLLRDIIRKDVKAKRALSLDMIRRFGRICDHAGLTGGFKG